MATFNKHSRYSSGVISFAKDDSRFIRLRRVLYFEVSAGDTWVTVQEYHKERPDLLSNEVYGRPDLFWVIFDNNGIIDCFEDLVIGQQLRCPAKKKVLESIKD